MLYSSGFGYTQTLSPVGSTLYSVCWTGDQFLIGGSGGGLYTSTTNGVSWVTRTSGTTENILNVNSINQTNVIALASTGVAKFSRNSTTWVNATSGSKQSYWGSVYVPEIGNKYVAVSQDGQISLSVPANVTRTI